MQSRLKSAVRTNLIRRRVTVPIPWWRDTVICDLPGSYTNDDLRRLAKLLPRLAEVGFEAVLIRPADPIVETGLPYLTKFVEKAHSVGLKVIARVFLLPEGETLDPLDSPPLLTLGHDVTALSERVRATLAAGCDGVDLGKIEERTQGEAPAVEATETFSESVRMQLAELASYDDSVILTTAFALQPKRFYMRHLTEEWFHHMRNDGLLVSPWNAEALQRVVAETYRAHDPLGHTAAWRHSLPGWSPSPAARDSEGVGWTHGATDDRRIAMNLFIASLPGAVYLPFLSAGGSIKAKERADKTSRLAFTFKRSRKQEFRADTIAHALHLRNALEMGHDHLAFVTGFPWANGDVAVQLTGNVMVVLNTGKQSVFVPADHRLLVSSSATSAVDSAGTEVPPDTCSWFMAAKPEPVDPLDYML